MAVILKGKHKGNIRAITQVVDDKLLMENGQIFRPDFVKLERNEVKKLREDMTVGTLWMHYTLSDTGLFRRRKTALLKQPKTVADLKK